MHYMLCHQLEAMVTKKHSLCKFLFTTRITDHLVRWYLQQVLIALRDVLINSGIIKILCKIIKQKSTKFHMICIYSCTW